MQYPSVLMIDIESSFLELNYLLDVGVGFCSLLA
jgi:hypothetical protein